ncbi:MAG: efflux RND transporter periplasmic adaptor subunit [Prolixibacteraceae bacterium]|jgi:membrane fusion protein, copper/silver efflux system|nr:efflux RND transporter periplasmic adaptor subunit [Prolixibacteraceae bacterium]MBT6007205.1 efflux RND transporter periplasmic adaptor subunit [Prolixibacteraceae bacterium]MBT6765932.1 efflux RND transporter periplasmic adaptor subunit [Prolixibacteraceae bacterium]MBT6997709.1 efflux RND transporter periplasmic adaptor subunit [Prolixibacteraceae bacterium]MBT7394719.1 efflux RND transporter periplasmic adaptor subunit [Prolixibacteraceae bacterium]
MKDIIQNITQNFKLIIGVLVIGIFLGWLFFHQGGTSSESINEQELTGHEGHDHESEDPTTWTCSMHPQIKQDNPGDCPICGMDLIPLASMDSGGDDVDPNEIMMSESAAKLADIQTMIVSSGIPQKSIRLQGKIQEDERRISELTARFGGRIEKLFVNFKGQNVRKGEKLATIYSPELVTSQRELLEAVSYKETRPALYKAAKGKLKLWDLNDGQIRAIEENGEPQLYFDILSPISGTVTMRHVALGDYVKEGTALFKVVDLTRVWALFDAYESDLPWIKINDKIEYSIQSLPGKSYSGKVSFIDPFIDSKTRVAKVRIELINSKLEVKPEMFTSGILESKIAGSGNEILIPKTALLWTGKRAVVYVKVQDRENPSFLYREIVLGPEAGNFYVVASGLNEGEEIAVNGVFKIDAASQLQGLQSMMNPDGGVMSTGHNHGSLNGEDFVQNESLAKSMQHVMVKAGGLCGMCKDRIETAALSVSGVELAKWEAESQMLHLNFDSTETNSDEIQKAVVKVGHDTEKYKAPDEVYNELPECCLYRN